MQEVKKLGRPIRGQNKRGKLIAAAKKLFVKHDYNKVSIRAIATEAEVDSALIGYYFQSKLGLFTAMVEETAQPVVTQLAKISQSTNAQSSSELMTTYYKVMSQSPDFPKLILKIASMQETAQGQPLKKILTNIINPISLKLFSRMHQQGVLQDGVDPLCMQISFFSMMVFPFLMPDSIKQALNFEISPEFMAQLALQNSQLLAHGCINAAAIKEIS